MPFSLFDIVGALFWVGFFLFVLSFGFFWFFEEQLDSGRGS